MQIHEVKRKSPNKKAKRVGRGSTRGKTSGRGGKGQTARAGHSVRPELRDIIKKIPKLRGHGKNRAKSVVHIVTGVFPVNVSLLESAFEGGAAVNPDTLREKGLVKQESGKFPPIKLLGDGEVTKKFSVSGLRVSKSAKEKIEKAGGTIS